MVADDGAIEVVPTKVLCFRTAKNVGHVGHFESVPLPIWIKDARNWALDRTVALNHQLLIAK